MPSPKRPFAVLSRRMLVPITIKSLHPDGFHMKVYLPTWMPYRREHASYFHMPIPENLREELFYRDATGHMPAKGLVTCNIDEPRLVNLQLSRIVIIPSKAVLTAAQWRTHIARYPID